MLALMFGALAKLRGSTHSSQVVAVLEGPTQDCIGNATEVVRLKQVNIAAQLVRHDCKGIGEADACE